MSELANEMFALVRWSIVQEWQSDQMPEVVSPELWEYGASFVTLEKHGTLRGCVGSLVAHKELRLDLIDNAKHAAFRDPRFSPLSQSEYADIEIEISLLSKPEPCLFATKDELRDKIVPGRDGVILSAMGRRATFLPQVWEKISSFDDFFSQLSLKAGIGSDPFFFNPTVDTYQVTRYLES